MWIGEGLNSFLRVQRERAEAGVFLFEVIKSQKQNTELPLNASDQEKSRLRHLFFFVKKKLFILSKQKKEPLGL